MQTRKLSKLVALLLLAVAMSGSVYAKPDYTSGSLKTDSKPAPSSAQTLTTGPNKAIKMTSAADGWLVGEHGLIKRYMAAQWLDYPSPITATLNAVDATTADAWAVGDSNTILHNTGTGWQLLASPIPTTTNFVAVNIVAPAEVWILGKPNVLLHYINGEWMVAATPPAIGPLSWGSPGDAWLVDGTVSAYHYSASSWSSTYIENPADSVLMLSPEAGWIGTSSYSFNGSNTVQYLRYTTSGWQPWPPQQNCSSASNCRNSPFPVRPVGTCQGETTDIYNLIAFTSAEFFATADLRVEYSCNTSNHFYYLWRNDVSSNQRDINLGNTYTHTLALSGSSGTDLWLLGNNAIRHWDGTSIAVIPVCSNPYTDVPANYYALSQIEYLTCRGIVSGTDSLHFSPAAPASRIQFAKMITLARGWPLITPAQPSFTDVPASHLLYTYVETAHAHGAINGATPAGCAAPGATYPCFLPNDNVTRAQTAIITQQAFGWPTDTTGGPHFTDVAQNFYAYAAIETCYHHGVVNGIGGGLFAPNANVMRAQIAVILYKALTLP